MSGMAAGKNPFTFFVAQPAGFVNHWFALPVRVTPNAPRPVIEGYAARPSSARSS